MAITLLGEKFDRGASEAQNQLSTDRVFQMQASARESGVLILASPLLPEYNDEHPDNDKILCRTRTASPEGEGDTWLVTCGYEPDSSTYSSETGDINPWDLPPYNISFGVVTYNRVLKEGYQQGDTRGNPTEAVLNSAQDPFDPPVETVEYNSLLKFSYNKRHFSLKYVSRYQGTINASPIDVLGYSVANSHGRLNNISASKIDVTDSDGDYVHSYYKIDIEVELAMKVFDVKVLDSGFYEFIGGEKYAILNSDIDTAGNDDEVTEPQKLNGDGILSEDAVYLSFNPFFTTRWSGLGMPRTLTG